MKAPKPPPDGYPSGFNSLGDHIRARRLDLGLKQKGAAQLIGVSASNLWNWENNRCQPEVRFMPKIIDFLGYSPYAPNLSFPEWLKVVRTAAGLTQEQFARKVGVDESTVAKWERGSSLPAQRSLRKIRSLITAG